jgi:hypothetical protein
MIVIASAPFDAGVEDGAADAMECQRRAADVTDDANVDVDVVAVVVRRCARGATLQRARSPSRPRASHRATRCATCGARAAMSMARVAMTTHLRARTRVAVARQLAPQLAPHREHQP